MQLHKQRRTEIKNNRTVTLWLLMLLLGVSLAYPSNTLAQSSPTGTLSGVVQDPNGALLPGVQVTIKNPGTGLTRNATTSDEGRWTFPALPVGTYEITYEMTGFKTLKRASVEVEAAVPRTLEDMLEVGEVGGAVITITEGTALATPDTSALARQLTADQLVQVPTSTRSFTQLLSAEAGVNTDLSPVLTNGNGNQSPSVNGTRTTSTSLSFNGVDATNITSNEGSLNNNIAPAPETLSEVKLQTSLYDASTGRSGGGNFQLITKSGTNTFNGSAYYYLQNEKFNANDFFFNKDGVARPKARRNEGGFTIGGPLVKDRWFFFGGYQRTQAITGFVPTASSITVLPAALGLISGERTKQNVFDAFAALNPGIIASIPNANAISDVAIRLLNLKNPATGDFIIPAPRAGSIVGRDTNVSGSVGGNPFIRQRNVFPAEFQQDQFTLKLDGRLSNKNTLTGTFFYSNFPGFDSFPDPGSLASPFVLRRADRNRTLAVSDQHIFGPRLINEVRFGYFYLDNTRRLDDAFLEITNASVGIPNPAVAFDNSPSTLRLGHYVGRPGTLMERFSFGGPNDSFNARLQKTFSLADNITYIRGNHTFRMGGEFKRHSYDTSLPEEQATEFEKFDNFTQLLRGVATEADTQFGITEKSFRFRDLSAYIADDWKVNRKLTLNLGLRWEWFGWPEEKQGRIGNFDPALVTNFDNPLSGFIVASNAQPTGFSSVDRAIAATANASTRHTLNGQDLNNFAPRVGFAYSPFESSKMVIRGGYGLFYDRPSAAFINTIFSNYPFLREVEVTFPGSSVPLTTAFSQQDPNFPFNQYLPNRIVRTAGAGGTYQLRDGTSVTRGADGTLNPTDPQTGLPIRGNIAETFEFRAIDRNLQTPLVHQWNLGVQYEITKNLLIEARYVGTKGDKLLQAVSFAQGYDLNDSATPDSIFERFNQAYVAAGSPNGPLNAGSTARAQGLGRAFGFANTALGGMIDYNLANAAGGVISFEARSPFLGFDVPEAILLGNYADSIYHSGQVSLTKRFSRGTQFNLAYTWSKSIDTGSADPGSTAGGGKPDLPNVGFTAQGNAFDLSSSRAVSDFDRPHRFSASFVVDLPTFGSRSKFLTGWQLSGFAQMQSGVPYSIFSPEVTVGNASQYGSTRLGSGGLYRLAFGRPSLCGSLGQLQQAGSDPTEQAFDPSVLCSPLSLAGGYPDNRGFGNLGRNVLRGLWQKRMDMGLSKKTQLTERVNLEFRWDVFNVFNNVNFATPNNIIGEAGSDFGKITDTVGGPRVMQFGMKVKF
jgi:hypothetical protein